jgi:hypothetical protein
MNWRIALALICLVVAGCASAENRAKLAQFEQECAAGDRAACSVIPYQRSVNSDQAVSNGVTAAAVVVLFPFFLFGSAIQAEADAGICGWGRNIRPC